MIHTASHGPRLLRTPALPRRFLHPDIPQGLLEEADVAGGEVGAVEAEVGPEAGARVVQELVEEVEPVQVLGLAHHAPEHTGNGTGSGLLGMERFVWNGNDWFETE